MNMDTSNPDLVVGLLPARAETHTSNMLFAPREKDLGSQQVEDKVREGKERVKKKLSIVTYERLSEFLLTNLFFGLETYYDISKVPEHYTWATGITRLTAPLLDLPPAVAQMFNSLGDVLEISVGSGIVRFSLAVVDEIVKSEPMKNVVRNAMQYKALNKMVEKTIGIERTDELTRSGEIKMSDDSQFWVALVPWTIVKAAHSLGLISLGANDHIGAPVPHMLIGQAFAVASLAAVHYGTKNSHEILKLTKEIFNKTKMYTGKAQQNVSDSLHHFQESSLQKISERTESIEASFRSTSKAMDEWGRKINDFDVNKVMPSPDQVWKKILGERVWNALGSIGVENEKDELA